MRLNRVERWVSAIRLFTIPAAVVAVGIARYPAGWAVWSWLTTALFGLGSLALFRLARSRFGESRPVLQSLVAQSFDTLIVTGYVLVFSFEPRLPVQQLLYIDLAAACVRFEIAGGLALAIASAPVVYGFEHIRDRKLGTTYSWKLVVLQTALETLLALIVGWLVRQLAIEGRASEARALEAESLRDELSRRADSADAAFEAERRTVAELRRLSNLRDDFVAMVLHEVRTPLASVIGAAEMLGEHDGELSVEQRQGLLALVSTESRRLAGLVSEVLDSARIDAGSFGYSFDELDLGGLVADAVAAAEAAVTGASISLELPSRLPMVRGDANRLRQVLANLIDNALKFSPAGAGVDVRATTANGDVNVEVRDHGPGIDAKDRELVFEKFGRAHVTSAKPGSGLGLYIARAIAEAHGGSLELDSEPGEGACFVLRLPASPVEGSGNRAERL